MQTRVNPIQSNPTISILNLVLTTTTTTGSYTMGIWPRNDGMKWYYIASSACNCRNWASSSSSSCLWATPGCQQFIMQRRKRGRGWKWRRHTFSSWGDSNWGSWGVYRCSFCTCKSVVQFLLLESFEFRLELVLVISICSSTYII